jgi:ABC-type dipeptide/oligopeptide/nickel transport system permease component
MRLGQGIVTLFVLATLVFLLARIIGSPVDMMVSPDATLAEREAMIHKLGLDRPLEVQYGEYMRGLLSGDVGDSLKFGRPVSELFFQRFPNTVRLAAIAMAMAIGFGFTLGMVSGTRRGSPIDHFSRAVSVIGMSAPAFWVGLMLMLVFAVRLGLVPVARLGGPESYILPAFTLSFGTLAGIARLVRSSMVEVLDSEYVKLARIKGVSPTMVVWKHCLRNALLPVMTFVGIHMALLLNGSVVVESVFAWPGVGRLIYEGITGRDYQLVQGCLLVVGFLIIVINLAVDILYAYIDPRIRYVGGKK